MRPESGEPSQLTVPDASPAAAARRMLPTQGRLDSRVTGTPRGHAWSGRVCAGQRAARTILAMSACSAMDGTSVVRVRLDPESAEWLRALECTGPQREAAVGRLHELLLRAARSELRRRNGQLGVGEVELNDLAYQAAADAVLAITGKVGQFRGESRFTTWAYKFVIFEVSTKIGRHFWRKGGVHLEPAEWERLPDRFGLDPSREVEWRELLAAIRHAVDEDLSERQRRVFVAIVLNGVPLDALVAELDSNRNAIYKTLFDARCKLRDVLAANGHVGAEIVAGS
jgi:RNA polymerase sigma-70 factor (ECF subfamily)